MKPLLLATLLLVAGCMNVPCANTTQTIWEPAVVARCEHWTRACKEYSVAKLKVEFQEPEAAIISVTTYYEGGSADYICPTATNRVMLECMFPESMHGKILKIKIIVAYKGRVFDVPIFCNVKGIPE